MTNLEVCTFSVPSAMPSSNLLSLVISGLVVRLVGVNEQQYAVWEEMELSQHSVLIRCHRFVCRF